MDPSELIEVLTEHLYLGLTPSKSRPGEYYTRCSCLGGPFYGVSAEIAIASYAEHVISEMGFWSEPDACACGSRSHGLRAEAR